MMRKTPEKTTLWLDGQTLAQSSPRIDHWKPCICIHASPAPECGLSYWTRKTIQISQLLPKCSHQRGIWEIGQTWDNIIIDVDVDDNNGLQKVFYSTFQWHPTYVLWKKRQDDSESRTPPSSTRCRSYPLRQGWLESSHDLEKKLCSLFPHFVGRDL